MIILTERCDHFIVDHGITFFCFFDVSLFRPDVCLQFALEKHTHMSCLYKRAVLTLGLEYWKSQQSDESHYVKVTIAKPLSTNIEGNRRCFLRLQTSGSIRYKESPITNFLILSGCPSSVVQIQVWGFFMSTGAPVHLDSSSPPPKKKLRTQKAYLGVIGRTQLANWHQRP